MTTTYELNKYGFPITTCTRCGGTGEHSYNQRFGTVCFKCEGTRLMVAKHAQKAWADFRDHVQNRKEVAAGKLQAGDLIAFNKKWCEVIDVTETDEACGSSKVNGVVTSTNFYVLVSVLNNNVKETFKTSDNSIMRRHSGKIDPLPFLATIKHPK